MEYLELALSIIGGASLVVAGIEKVTHVTPSTKDDYYVGKAKRALGLVVSILDRVALNPNSAKARP